MQWSIWHYLALVILGIMAGIINIMAGGGSNLILPVLMMFNVPADVANGSNRIAVLAQSIGGIHGFAKAKQLPKPNALNLLIPTLIGGLLGALLASFLPVYLLKPLLLSAMLFVAGFVLCKPQLFAVSHHRQASPTVSKTAWWCAFGTGIYGGFVQAGVGLLFIPLLMGLLHYDAIRANALKVVYTLGFTVVSVGVFLLNGQINWGIGLSLAFGSLIGARIGVLLTLRLSPAVIRWAIFVMTLIAVVMVFI